MTRYALLLAALVSVSTVAAGCSGGGGSSSGASVTAPGVSQISVGATCTPAPLPTPGAMLINPAPNATGVSRTIGTVTFQVNLSAGTVEGTVASVSLVPASGSAISTTQITAQGTPSPVNGITVFNAGFGATLAANTTYAVSVSGREPDGCNDPYTSPAGSFTTGS